MMPERVAEGVALYVGDCLEVLASLPDASVDAVVTDPPYGLAEHPVKRIEQALTAWLTGDRAHVPDGRGFMGREWDKFVPPPAAWDECYRVLKPGGHLLAFAAPRTYDLMGISIRLAGFDVFDSIDWINGQGFPKSLNVSKAIDKIAPRSGMFAGFAAHFAARRTDTGLTLRQVAEHFPSKTGGITGCAWNWEHGENVPTAAQWATLQPLLGLSDRWLPLIERIEAERAVTGRRSDGAANGSMVGLGSPPSMASEFDVTSPATKDAARWDGWGTALKPAHEPIVLAMKPLDGTYAANVLEHGTGALNIAGCSVGTTVETWPSSRGPNTGNSMAGGVMSRKETGDPPAGRWPPNVLLSEEAAEELDRQSGVLTSGAWNQVTNKARSNVAKGVERERAREDRAADAGGASRFFPVFRYQAKAPASERPRLPDGTAWPTVKPLELMRWLVRLVTPPGGTVLDLFAGTGTTGEACLLEGFPCVLIEKDPVAVELIRIRLGKPAQPDLFAAGA